MACKRAGDMGGTSLVGGRVSVFGPGGQLDRGHTDTPLFKPTATTQPLLLAQRNENPGGGVYKTVEEEEVG